MADTKLADLTALTTPSGDDILYIVDDPAGTPLDRKIALNNLFTRGTITASAPVLDASQTWNNGAVTFTGLKFNVVSDTSAAASLLMDLQVGGSSVFVLRKSGGAYGPLGTAAAVSYGATANVGTGLFFPSATNLGFSVNGTSQFNISTTSLSAPSTLIFGFSSGAIGTAVDTILTRRAAANLRLGAADAAAPVAQTLSVQSVVAGTTNTAGTNLTITGSQGTGTGAGGSIIFQVAPAGSSGTAQNALATALTINADRTVTADGAIAATGSTASNVAFARNGTPGTGVYFLSSTNLTFAVNGTGAFNLSTVSASLPSNYSLGWLSGAMGTGGDTFLARDAANTLALRNGANAQTFNIYNTFTSSTNFERFRIFAQSAAAVLIGTEKGSAGGTARALELQTDATSRLTLDTVGSARIVTALTVATLPGTPLAGMIARVTDATLPVIGATVAGGGAAYALVNYNGANWTVIGV
jgi:hypothetical protein